MKIRKKTFLVTLLITILIIPLFALANDSEYPSSYIQFTKEVAIAEAEEFGRAVSGKDLIAVDPTRIFDKDGQAIGFLVNFTYQYQPYGYVIFDTTHEDLISEHSFGCRAKSPLEIIYEVGMENNAFSRSRNATNHMYRIAPFTYAVVNEEDQAITSAGEIIENISEYIEVICDNPFSRASKNWNDPFVVFTIGGYSIQSQRNLTRFHSLSQQDSLNAAQRYACVVTAMWIICDFYGGTRWGSLRAEYLDLWYLSGTFITDRRGNYIFGATNQWNAGPAVQQFMRGKGITINFTHTRNPSYQFFINSIHSGNPAIIFAWINPQSGHAMTVQGYATIRRTNGTTMNSLLVADGWGHNVRYLNFNFGFTHMYGTSFRR